MNRYLFGLFAISAAGYLWILYLASRPSARGRRGSGSGTLHGARRRRDDSGHPPRVVPPTFSKH